MTSFSVIGLSAVLAKLLPEPHAGLLAGLLFGTKASISKELSQELINSGTIHIIALSGQNLSIMADLVGFLLLKFVSKRMAQVITLGLILWFVWFVGPSSSIVRAAIMASLSIFAYFFGKQYISLLALTLAVGMMLVLNFSWLSDLSFQLSALATLGIILFGPKQKGKKMGFIESDLRLTLAAQTLTVPLIFWQFRRISLIAPFTNIAIAWVIAPLSGLGWVTAIAGWLWGPLGQPLAWVDYAMLEYMIRVVTWFGRLPFASVTW